MVVERNDQGHTLVPSPSQLSPWLETTVRGLSLHRWGFPGIKEQLWETHIRDPQYRKNKKMWVLTPLRVLMGDKRAHCPQQKTVSERSPMAFCRT